MTDYTKLVEALLSVSTVSTAWELMRDAATAIEELQQISEHYEQTAKDYWKKEACEYKAQLPKRGEWELIDGAEPMRWGCSRCKYMSWETSNYCPRCGAKMEVQE